MTQCDHDTTSDTSRVGVTLLANFIPLINQSKPTTKHRPTTKSTPPPKHTARRWIDTQAGGGPTYAPGADPLLPLTKADLQDRWNQHTKHCLPCQTALAAIEKKAANAKVVAAVCFAALCALLGAVGPQAIAAGGWPAAAAAAAAAGVAVALKVAQGAAAAVAGFKFVAFEHADNH